MLHALLGVLALQGSLAPQDPPSLTIAGLLLEHKKPVPAAELVVTSGGRSTIDGGLVLSSGYPPARVLARPTLGAGGRFELELALPGEQSFGGDEPVLLAWREGRCLGAWPVDPTALAPGIALRCEADAAEPAKIRIEDEGGKPVAGARLRVLALRCGRACVVLPEELAAKHRATTAEDGIATFPELGATRIAALEIATERSGLQRVCARRDGSTLGVVRLRACGKVEGKITSEPVAPGLFVEVTTYAPLGPGRQVPMEERRLQGHARVPVAADGTFVVPVIAAGQPRAQLYAAAAKLSSVMPGLARPAGQPPEPPVAQVLEPGQTFALEVALAKLVPMVGSVRDRDGKPVPGVTLRCSAQLQSLWATSGADGRFEFLVPPGRVSVAPWQLPDEFLPAEGPARGFGAPFEVTADQPAECPPIVLTTGERLLGRVVDNKGKPIAGARVLAESKQDEDLGGGMRSTRHVRRWAVSGADGAFALRGLSPERRVEVTAAFGDARTAAPVTATPGEPVSLALVPLGESGRLLRVTVRDEKGSPIEGATLLVTRLKHDARVMYSPEPYEAEGGVPRTNEAGASELALEPRAAYCVRVEAAGHAPAWSPWVEADEGTKPGPIDVTLRRLGAMNGIVVDERHLPVSGARVAEVSAGTETGEATTDAQGRFHLGQLRAGGVVLLALAGERAAWVTCVQPTSAAGIIMLGGNPKDRAPAALPSEDSLKALGARVLEPLLESLATSDDSVCLRTLQVLARHDPARALRNADEVAFKDAYYAQMIKRDVASALLARDRGEAVMLAAALPTPSLHCMTLIEAARTLPADSAERRRLIGDALAVARQAETPQMQVAMLAEVAEAYSDAGDEKSAARILAETRPLADGLPSEEWAGYARCLFAEQLARTSLDAALKIAAGQKDGSSFDRHHGNIAHEIAALDPAGAERVFGMLKSSHARFAPRVCYRMAPVDLARARRIAAHRGVGVRERAWCFTVMAEALAAKDPAAAKALLEDALAAAREAKAPEILAAMLPCVQRLAPETVPLWIAKTLACLRPGEAKQFYEASKDAHLFAWLALALRPHAPALAAALVEPVWQEAATFAGVRADGYDLSVLLALLDPDRAGRLVAGWPKSEQPRLIDPIVQARQSLAKMLGSTPEERWAALLERELRLWPIDKEDL